jgi:hypothetical protein
VKVSIKSRALVAGVASAALLAAPLAMPASAAQSASCSKLVAAFDAHGKYVTTISQCTPAGLVAGATSVSAVSKTGPNKGQLVNTLSWKNGKGTTKAVIKYAPAKTQGKCPAGTGHVTITGSVSSGTGVAATIIKKGEAVSISICAFTKGPKVGQAQLEPGSKYRL